MVISDIHFWHYAKAYLKEGWRAMASQTFSTNIFEHLKIFEKLLFYVITLLYLKL